MAYKINHADILDWAKNYDGEPFDGILCDPPYELGFMGKSWDSTGIAFNVELWTELLRICKPGAHLLAFSGSRTYHRMACAIEDAGFEIRDMIEWVYGSGFPKSLNIGKAVDKIGGQQIGWFGRWLREWREENNITQKEVAKLFPSKTGGLTGCVANWELGFNMPTNEQFNLICETFNLPFENIEQAEREYISSHTSGIGKAFGKNGWESGKDIVDVTKGHSEWEGYGTALKPAHEPCVLARKPIKGTVANNCLEHGTGGLNIDGSRVKTINKKDLEDYKFNMAGNERTTKINGEKIGLYDGGWKVDKTKKEIPSGRFPANLIHDGSDEVEAVFPQSKSAGEYKKERLNTFQPDKAMFALGYQTNKYAGDSGSASRFFYTAKASKSERNAGLDGLPENIGIGNYMAEAKWINDPRHKDGGYLASPSKPQANHHPTVKPLALTKYLANLIKPPKGGRLLVPFSGSGSEMIGALQAGWEYVEGVELTEEYIPIAEARIKYWLDKIDKQMEIL